MFGAFFCKLSLIFIINKTVMETHDYTVNNLVYRITSNAETHQLLQNNDANFFQEYIAKTTGPELIGVTENSEQLGTSKFKWDSKSTRFFIEEYAKRKEKFRDPTIRKKTLWSEVLTEMHMAGFMVEDDDILDRKMRNMRKTYKTIKENIRNTGRARVQWEYFERFEEIFAEDRTINCGPVISSMAGNNRPPSEIGNTCPSSSNAEIAPTDGVSNDFTEFVQTPRSGDVNTDASRPRINSLQHMRKQQLSLEERRVKTTEEMLEQVKETNALLREKNQLMRDFLEIYRSNSNQSNG